MGYTTTFEGEFKITPSLTEDQLETLSTFMEDRHGGNVKVAEGFPSFYCDWTTDGNSIYWNGSEKSYEMLAWIKLLKREYFDKWGCTLTGEVFAQGEDQSDKWGMRAKDGKIVALAAKITFVEEE